VDLVGASVLLTEEDITGMTSLNLDAPIQLGRVVVPGMVDRPREWGT
jgi:hypothetical protein